MTITERHRRKPPGAIRVTTIPASWHELPSPDAVEALADSCDVGTSRNSALGAVMATVNGVTYFAAVNAS